MVGRRRTYAELVAAKQSGATVVVEPADGDPVTEGHQVALAEATEITVTVTSPDGGRARHYRVALGPGSIELGLVFQVRGSATAIQ